MGDSTLHKTPSPDWSDSASGMSFDIHSSSKPVRPSLPNRQSSGTMVVPRDSLAVGPIELNLAPDDVRTMSPRRTSEDIQALGKEAREELQKHAKALQESLVKLFNRIEAVKEEHDKLDNNNRFLQKYIGDLMSTSKITSTSSRNKK